MKKLMPFMMLASVIACSGSNGGAKQNLSKYVEALNSAQRGQVTIVNKDGTDTSIRHDNGNYSAPLKIVKSKGRHILLKFEDGKRYVLEEMKNEDGSVGRMITIENFDVSKDLDEVLKLPGSRIVNDVLFFESSSVINDTNEEFSIRQNYTVKGQVNLLKPNCESTTVTSTDNGVLETRTQMIAIQDTSITEVNSCGEILSATQLKALNLKNITVCDNTNEVESSCSTMSDMSQLLSDL